MPAAPAAEGLRQAPSCSEPISCMKGAKEAPSRGAGRIWGHLNGTATKARPGRGWFLIPGGAGLELVGEAAAGLAPLGCLWSARPLSRPVC